LIHFYKSFADTVAPTKAEGKMEGSNSS